MIATQLYTVWEAAVIVGGIVAIAVLVAATVITGIRENKGRPLMPWGARMKVEKAKAQTEQMEESLKQQAIEVKRLAIDHQRTRVMDAIQNDNHDEVERLGLPSANPRYRDV